MEKFLTTKKPSGLGALLKRDQVLSSLADVATGYLRAEQIGPMFAAAALKEPKILNCTISSIIDAALFCSRYGLGPGDRGVYLVPFSTTLQTIIDYKGLIQLAYRSGMVESMNAEVIYENDAYTIEYGTNRQLNHVPKIGDRGKPIAAYAVCTLTNGASGFKLLEESEILNRRPSKLKSDSPWHKWPMAMWKKTAVHDLAKWIPLTPEMADFARAIGDSRTETLDTGTPSRLKQIAHQPNGADCDNDDSTDDVVDVEPVVETIDVPPAPSSTSDELQDYLNNIELCETAVDLEKCGTRAAGDDKLSPADKEVVSAAFNRRMHEIK